MRFPKGLSDTGHQSRGINLVALSYSECGTPIEHWEDNTSYICVVKAKIVTPRVKHIYIYVCFLQGQFENVSFPKYEKYSDMSSDMCTKPCPGPIIICITKCMTVFRFYPTRDKEHYQLMRLHAFVVNEMN